LASLATDALLAIHVRFGDLRFSWDDRKAAANERKHRVGFDEAITVFVDPLARDYDDPDHSEGEHRALLIGRSWPGRLSLVVHVERTDTIRIVSARKASRM
jgi:uncharacterized DUF497 family protein